MDDRNFRRIQAEFLVRFPEFRMSSDQTRQSCSFWSNPYTLSFLSAYLTQDTTLVLWGGINKQNMFCELKLIGLIND